jgi:hypothetical protein
LNMSNGLRAVAALCLPVLSLAAGAAAPADRFAPGVTYYFDSFDPGRQPWEPGQDLNIEEVFKNYQYYEIVFDKTGKEITVNRHVQGHKADSIKYRIMPNWSLQKALSGETVIPR